MAAGRPVLCSDIETLREVAGDVVVAYFKPNSVKSIEEAITKASSLHDKEREFFGAAAKKRAHDNFTIEKTAKGYIKEYQKLYRTDV
jgi:glycosyltransferase involved in cell wall biosynthesis